MQENEPTLYKTRTGQLIAEYPDGEIEILKPLNVTHDKTQSLASDIKKTQAAPSRKRSGPKQRERKEVPRKPTTTTPAKSKAIPVPLNSEGPSQDDVAAARSILASEFYQEKMSEGQLLAVDAMRGVRYVSLTPEQRQQLVDIAKEVKSGGE